MSDMSFDEDAEERTIRFARMLLQAFDTERAREIDAGLAEGGLNSLRKFQINPRDYPSERSFCLDYAAVKLLSKLEWGDAEARRDVAIGSFKAAERRCESTNVRLFHARPLKRGVEQILSSARRKIARVIGERPDVREIIGLMRWGPGATATLKGDQVRPEAKMLEPKLSVTPKGYLLARHLVGLDLNWTRARIMDVQVGPPNLRVEVVGPCSLLSTEFNIIPWMRVVTVPKDFATDRTIGAEPTMNTYMQQGVGRALKRRLYRAGVNLRNQAWNQTLARCAGAAGLATLDLSSASDSVSYWLVEDLLPPAWFQLLSMLRSEVALVDGELIPLEKFSSMGNAYTFELESLIFWAVSMAVSEECEVPTEFLSVYGDDIIVDKRAYVRLCEVLQVLGFSVNPEKSYASGRFYESCGVHAFDGVDVTPMYQKELLHGVPELVRAHNRVLRWCVRTGVSSHRFRQVLAYLRQQTKAAAKLAGFRVPRVPTGTEGDAGLWTDNLVVQWCDGKALLDVLEIVPCKSPSMSDAALLAITLSQSKPKNSSVKGDIIPTWGEITDDELPMCELGALFNRPQSLFDLRMCESYEGEVVLRGDPEYRVRRRWVHYRGTPVKVSDLSPTRFLVVDDWLTIRALIPQLRGSATLR